MYASSSNNLLCLLFNPNVEQEIWERKEYDLYAIHPKTNRSIPFKITSSLPQASGRNSPDFLRLKIHAAHIAPQSNDPVPQPFNPEIEDQPGGLIH